MNDEHFPVLGMVTIILLIIRIAFDNSAQLVIIIASINIIALLLVVYQITKGTKEKAKNQLLRYSSLQDIISREEKQINHNINCHIWIPIFFISVSYLIFFRSELGNDILSIIALGLSLSDTSIINFLVNSYIKE